MLELWAKLGKWIFARAKDLQSDRASHLKNGTTGEGRAGEWGVDILGD